MSWSFRRRGCTTFRSVRRASGSIPGRRLALAPGGVGDANDAVVADHSDDGDDGDAGSRAVVECFGARVRFVRARWSPRRSARRVARRPRLRPRRRVGFWRRRRRRRRCRDGDEPRRFRRAPSPRPRGDVARARPPRARRARGSGRGGRAGAARGAARGVCGASAGEAGRGVGRLPAFSRGRGAREARGGHAARWSSSGRGWSSSTRRRRRRRRRRGSWRGSPRSTCARGEPPPRREGAPPQERREAVSVSRGGGARRGRRRRGEGSRRSRDRPRLRATKTARGSGRPRACRAEWGDAPRRASPHTGPAGSRFETFSRHRQECGWGRGTGWGPSRIDFRRTGGRSDIPPLDFALPQPPLGCRVASPSPRPHTARARDTHVRRASFRLDGPSSSSRLSGPPRASRHVDRRCPRAWRSSRRAPAAEADPSDDALDAPRGRCAPRDDWAERR